MFKELLSRDRMKTIDSCSSWKHAVRRCAKPLIDEGFIEEAYVGRMIEGIQKFGSYYILEDGFALPHAPYGDDVKKMGMSLLYLEKPVYLSGQPVQVFWELCTMDNESHLDTLAAIGKLFREKRNMDLLLSGDLDAIYELLMDYDRRVEEE